MHESTRASHPRRRVGSRLAMLVAVLGMAVGGAVASAPAASADSCAAGDACVYRNTSGGASLAYSNPGNFSGSVSAGANGGYVWNNGVRYPERDHITVTTRTSGGLRYRICLHYGARKFGGPENDPTAGVLLPGEVVTGWTWRGECGANEDRWVRY